MIVLLSKSVIISHTYNRMDDRNYIVRIMKREMNLLRVHLSPIYPS